ncbi:Calx-beta domain-containing protein, partial [Neptunomonas phycophila]
TVTFNYTTTDADGNDYVAVGSVTILAGETDATFTIDTVNDNIAEGDEDFTVSIDTITDGGLEDVRVSNNDSVTTTIEDNDTVEISINDAPTVDESAGTMTFTVTLSNPSDAPVTVDYASQDGTATAGLDYTAVTGTLTFAPGETTQTITVPVTDDYLAEGSETLDMVLSNPSNATIADGVG